MKKHFISILLLLFTITLFAQQDDCLKRLEERAVQVSKLETKVQQLEDENKDLQKQLKQKRDNIARQEKNLRDSLSAPISKLSAELDSANMALLNKANAIKQMEEDYKNQIGIEKGIASKKGKEDVLHDIAMKYQEPFEDLINSLSTYSIESDQKLFKNLNFDDVQTVKKINDLLTYKNAAQLLEVKFDSQNVIQAKTNLNKIQTSYASVPDLIDLLGKYEIRKEGLVKTIQEIQKLNDLPAEGNEVISSEKWKEIWKNINQYLFAYGVNLEEYPNFRRCIFILISLKQANIDSDISELINQL